MRVVSFGSGSKGNAYCLQCGDASILIDCGVAYRTLHRRFAALGAAGLPLPSAVLVTHSHGDHVKGLACLLRHRDVPVFANALTAETVAREFEVSPDAFYCFEDAQEFEVGGFTVTPFSIPHDTSDPVGYQISAGGETYFHATDLGTPLPSIGERFAQAHLATLESNHDANLLIHSGRAPQLIERILGPRGHLSNDQAGDFVARYASPRLQALALAHLSHDCNDATLARRVMSKALDEIHRPDVTLKVFVQDETVDLATD